MSIAIALFASAIMAIIARRANARFATHDRLPMQWWIDGRPTWFLPRSFALAFIPLLGGAILVATALATPREGQEDMLLPVMLLLTAAIVAVQSLHCWMIDRHFRP